MRPNFVNPTFMGLQTPYNQAKAVLIGCTMDDTSSFRPGSRFAPNNIRCNSIAIESYSPALGSDLEDIPIADLGDIDLPCGKKERSLDKIAQTAGDILADKKFLVAIGGEHLISLPLITEQNKIHHSLNVIHLDAHSDLRDEYQGETLSHATVMKRVMEIIGPKNLYQIGIRSGTKNEFDLMNDMGSLYGYEEQDLARMKYSVGTSPCYISLDLDILDPGIFPATGTPEPGGINFNQLINILYYMKDLNVIGIDVVEYNPLLDLCGQCSIIAAKLIREMILVFYRQADVAYPNQR
ncbi:agmatinase [bacterium]|nr:agmatinase [bacterium]